MRKQNPITEYAIENLRAGKDTAEILDTFMQSDLYDGVAQRRVLGNKVAVIKQVLDLSMKPADTDAEDIKLFKDENGPNTTFVSSYNVRAIPTLYLMNREGVIIGRDMNFEELNAKIAKLL